MQTHLFFLFTILLLIACRKQQDDGVTPTADLRIRLDAPAVGQSSRYVHFRGEHAYNQTNFAFAYLPDTLVLTIVDAEADRFLIEEKLTPGSASRHGANQVYWPDAVLHYYWQIHLDTLFVRSLPNEQWVSSRVTDIFYVLPLTQVTAPLINIQGWRTTNFNGSAYRTATDPTYSLFGRFYPHLNIVVDDREMSWDGPGTWFAYSARDGIVKTASYGFTSVQGFGWDLLAD